MASNIDTTMELNKLIVQQNQLYADQAKLIKGQMAMLRQMAEMMSEIDPSSLVRSWGDVSSAMEEAEDNMASAGTSGQQTLGSMNEAVEEGVESLQNMGQTLKNVGKGLIAIAGPAAIMRTLGNALTIAASAGVGLLHTMMEVGSAIGNVGIAIITAPFKMLRSLMESASGGGSELRQNLENIRKAIIDMARGMKGQLAETGLSTYRIFGNLAERLATITEYATQLGAMFNNLRDSLVANAEAFGAYVKGLGLTENGMKGVARLALSTGTSFTEVGRQITTMAYGMGEAFGINGLEVSRAVGDMLSDVRNFGSLSVKQLTQVAVFANKLGLEFQDLQGTIDQFDNFEDAANAAAQLSQAFGLNVDALELIQEQDPAARFEQLRKAFFQTGRSVEQMTRQEMRLLAAQTGLSEEAVKLGFSLENQGVGYADVQKQADLTQKKQLTQAEAMQKLSNSIERLVKSGGQLQGGFFSIFFQGFVTGVQRSAAFRAMLRDLHRVMRIVFQSGRQLGNFFVKEFPGVSDVLKGIRGLFSPAEWRKTMSQVVDAFRGFFRMVTTDPEAGLQSLYRKLQEIFFNHFSSQAPAGQKAIQGFGTFFKTMFRVAVAAIRLSLVQISSLLSQAFTQGTAANDFVMGAYKMLDRLGQAILAYPWHDTINNLKEGLLQWFIDATSDIDWNAVAATVSDLLMESLSFSLRALSALGNVILDALSQIDFATGLRLLGAAAVFGLLAWAQATLPALLLEAGTVLVMDFLLPGIITGLEMAGAAVFSAIGGWPTLIVAALAGAGIALLEWGDDLMDYAAEALDNFGPMLANSIEEYLPVILDNLYNFMENLPDMFVDAIVWIGGAIKSSVEWLITSVANLFTSSGNLDNALTRFFSRIGTAIGNVFTEFLKTHFPRVYEGIVTLQNFFAGVGVIARTALAGVLSWKARYIDPMVNAVRSAVDSIRNSFASGFAVISQTFSGIMDGMRARWQELSASIQPVVDTIQSFLSISRSDVQSETGGGGFLGGLRKSFQDIVDLGAQSQSAAAATAQKTTASIAATTQQASAAVQATTADANSALTQTAQKASATSAQIAQATKQGAASATAGSAPTTAGGGFFDGLFGGGSRVTSPAVTQRSQALEELNGLRPPSRSQVARIERDIHYATERYTKGIANDIRDLVTAVNAVTSDLNSIGDSPQRINVQLKQLANRLGVGGSQRLEIRNRNFTIQMNVNVTLDADEFEQALSSRPGGSTFVVRPENE